MASLNKVQLIGNLGRDVDLTYTQSGKAVAKISIATSEKWTTQGGEKKESTEWHNIVIWDKLAENCAQYIQKGSSVYVEGKLQTRSYEDKSGVKKYVTEIVAREIKFLGGKPSSGHAEEEAPSQASAPSGGGLTDDDIPF